MMQNRNSQSLKAVGDAATMSEDQSSNVSAGGGSAIRRFAPLIALVALMAVAYFMGWHKYLSFKTLALNYEVLKEFIANNLLYALLLYALAYIVVVALSLPGGLVMTLTGGLLFGWQIGAPVTIVAATIGATIIFMIAKTSLGESLVASAGPWLAKLQDGFKENGLSYLLFLRLVPAFPFTIVNLAPAILGVPLRTYVLGTFFGIMPGSTTFSVLGAGLGSVIDGQSKTFNACVEGKGGGQAAIDACPFNFDPSQVVTKEILAAFTMLALVALIPVAYKKWGNRSAAK